MIQDSLQSELDRYYPYGDDHSLRYSHRLRIDQISNVLKGLSSHAGKNKQLRALDAGCCNGVYSVMLAEAGYEVVGIDINEREVETARQWAAARGLADRITFRVGDIQKLTPERPMFDIVLCSEVLEHLDDPVAGAMALQRNLKDDGVAIISMPNMGSLFGLLQVLYRKSGLRSLLGKPPLDLHQMQHSRYWFGNILHILKSGGFDVVRAYSTSLVPYLWELDACLSKVSAGGAFCGRLDNAIGRLPFCRYLGFSFIAVVRKVPKN